MIEQGRLVDAADARPSDHVCWTFGSDAEHRELLGRYIKAGLERSERVLHFTARYADEDVLSAVDRAGADPEPYLASGQLILADARPAYLGEDGTFDQEMVLEGFRSGARQAVADGYRALRASGEVSWLLDEGHVDPELLVAYEAVCDRMVATLPLVGLCGFDTRTSDSKTVAAVAAVHRRTIGVRADAVPFSLVPGTEHLMLLGVVDLLYVPSFARALAAVTSDERHVTIDVSGLTFIVAAAAREITKTAGELRARGGELRLVGAGPSIAKTLLDGGVPAAVLGDAH